MSEGAPRVPGWFFIGILILIYGIIICATGVVRIALMTAGTSGRQKILYRTAFAGARTQKTT